MAKQPSAPAAPKSTPAPDAALVIPTGTDERTELILRLGNLRCADSNRIIQLVLSQTTQQTPAGE